MKGAARVLGAALLLLALSVAAILIFGPREPVNRASAVDPASLPEDLDAWLAEQESGVANLRPELQKRIVWAGASGAVTPLAVVYLHGFSASSAEIEPVPDRVAAALGANLFLARLSGHGRDGAAMAEPSADDWMADTAEAFAIGRRLGQRVLVIATSTGGTLAALAATDAALAEDLAGVVLVSPNFRIRNRAAVLVTLPWARHWLPLLVGAERGFEPANAAHAANWTPRYPVEAVVPMAALVRDVARRDLSAARVPALFLYSEHDTVVTAEATHAAYDAWGGPKARELLVMGPEDDPASHVIAGDILSPGQTDRVVAAIVGWAKAL